MTKINLLALAVAVSSSAITKMFYMGWSDPWSWTLFVLSVIAGVALRGAVRKETGQ